MKPSRFIPLMVIVAVLSYMAGQFNVPWSRRPERLERNPHADLPHRELRRVTSPDGVVDAILGYMRVHSNELLDCV